ncbi:uncharacterized protein LOC136073130 [Hydra vulgaris]|uniref:uncharacterized protein LOC136073130 n=1 Tax=Hydra vulgaris TaxID=6087 RepID=UPI0032EA714D
MGREFVNAISKELYSKTGTIQRITSAYHPQANGLVERQNQTIKRILVKVLDEAALEWPYIIDSVLFSLRVRKHKSTGFSPFALLYQREAVLPIDIDCNLIDFNDSNALSNDDFSNKKIVSDTFHAMNKMKNKIFDDAYKNIEKSQKRQKHDYDKRIAPNNEISINKKVLLRNSKRDDRKGGKLVKPWTGPYIVTSISSTNNCTLKNLKGQILKTKYNLTKLCLYNEKITNDEQEITFDEINMQISNDKIGKYATIEMRTSISEKFEIIFIKLAVNAVMKL